MSIEQESKRLILVWWNLYVYYFQSGVPLKLDEIEKLRDLGLAPPVQVGWGK